MKTFKTIIILLIVVSYSNKSFGQGSERNFSQILQSYYLNKDKDLLEKTIYFVNDANADHRRLKPLLTGFFGALFPADAQVKADFVANLSHIEKPEFKQLFAFLSSANIDSIYLKTPVSPSYNDMSWASYFATGNVKYLDKIIANTSLADERVDRDLFLTGVSAKWSLCSNALQDSKIKDHLRSLKDNKKIIKEILEKTPAEHKQQTTTIIQEQRAKGLWK